MRVRWFGMAAVVAMAALVAVVGSAPPAVACSCAAGSLRDQIASHPEVVIGTPTGVVAEEWPDGGTWRRGFAYEVSVQESLKGVVPAVMEVRTGTGGGDCGVTLEIGVQVGLLVWVRDGVRSVGLCNAPTTPEELRRAGTGPPPITGSGPPAFVAVGRFGAAWLGLLDARGRPLGWTDAGVGDTADGSAVRVATCDGGARLVGVRASSDRPDLTVTVFRTATLEPLWTAAVARPDAERFDVVAGVACAGDEVRLLVRHGPPGQEAAELPPTRVIRVAGAGSAVSDRPGADLVLLDPRDGSVLRIDRPGDGPTAPAPRTVAVVREGATPDDTTEIAAVPVPAGFAVVGAAAGADGRLAFALGAPGAAPGRESVASIVSVGPDGAVLGTIDPQMPGLDLRHLTWSDDGRVLVIGEGGARAAGVVLVASPDGGSRTVFDLDRYATSLTAADGVLLAPTAMGDDGGPIVIDAAGAALDNPLPGVAVTGVAAFPSGPGTTPVVLDPGLATRAPRPVEARVVPVAASAPASGPAVSPPDSPIEWVVLALAIVGAAVVVQRVVVARRRRRDTRPA